MPYKDAEQQRAAQAAHYQRNKGKYYDQNQRHRQGIIDKVTEIKNQPCVDCGGTFPPCAIDFDHREGEEKLGDVSRLWRNRGWATVLAEIEKCDLICANCHRIRTWKRSNGNPELLV